MASAAAAASAGVFLISSRRRRCRGGRRAPASGWPGGGSGSSRRRPPGARLDTSPATLSVGVLKAPSWGLPGGKSWSKKRNGYQGRGQASWARPAPAPASLRGGRGRELTLQDVHDLSGPSSQEPSPVVLLSAGHGLRCKASFWPPGGAGLPGTRPGEEGGAGERVAGGGRLRFTESISTLQSCHPMGKRNSWPKAPGFVPKAPGKNRTHFSFQEWV